MKKLVFVSLLALSGLAQADVNGYVGAQGSLLTLKSDGVDSLNSAGASLNAGVRFNPYFALEGRIGTGDESKKKSASIDGTPFRASITPKLYTGIYAKGIVPVDSFEVYGLVGFTHVKVTPKAAVDIPGIPASVQAEASESGNSAAFGIGGAWSPLTNKALSFSLEWARLYSHSGDKLDALSLGATYNFGK